MDNAARVCAIITGSVAFACGLVSLTWWIDPEIGAHTSGALSAISFMTGFLGFAVMFVMLVARTGGKRNGAAQREFFSLVWTTAPRRLRLGLAIVLANAVLIGMVAFAQNGQWGIYDPYGWHHCPWPLSANHNTEHMCVTHARYLEAQHAGDWMDFAFGTLFLTIDCLAFTTLARTPRGRPRSASEGSISTVG
jgi:hypothetical protein